MADAVYKVTEVVGTSTESIHQAVRNAIDKASQTLRNLDRGAGQQAGAVGDVAASGTGAGDTKRERGAVAPPGRGRLPQLVGERRPREVAHEHLVDRQLAHEDVGREAGDEAAQDLDAE